MTRIFITGGNGYIGSVITEFAVAQGYEVIALSRSEASDDKLRGLGAVPVRGDLTSVEVIGRESARADQVILLATAYTVGDPSYDAAWPIDRGALDAAARTLAGTEKPLLITSGTMVVAADPLGGETTEASPLDPNPIISRGKIEEYAMSLVEKGTRAITIRLAPYVYGRCGSGVKMFMGMSAQGGGVICVDGGTNHTTTVHVDDAARLYLLAAEKARAGEVFNASSSTTHTAREILQTIATQLNVPVRDITEVEAEAQLGGMFSKFLKTENRASGGKAVQELDWRPREIGIVEDISMGSYADLAKQLRAKP